jgi:hypothetical protein
MVSGMRVLIVGAVACVAVTGCGGHRAADACSGVRLAAEQGSGVSEKTGQHTLLVEVRDDGAACTVEGVPKVELLDGRGHELHFSYSHAGDQMIARARPRPVRLAPGQPGLVELNKYRCDIRDAAVARTVRLTLPHLPTLTLRVGPEPVLDWCPAEKPSSTVDVSAVLAAPLAVSSDGRAVLQDVYDGHLDERWSCASLRAAIARLPVDGPIYSTIPRILEAAAARACASPHG